MSSTLVDRISHEREFHNQLEREPLSYRMVRIASEIFYNKDEDGVLWGPVWRSLDLRGKTVLDYGCGSGGFSCVLALRGARVHGNDISEYLISRARAESARHNVAVESRWATRITQGFRRQPSITFLAMAFCTTSTWIRPTGKLPAF